MDEKPLPLPIPPQPKRDQASNEDEEKIAELVAELLYELLKKKDGEKTK